MAIAFDANGGLVSAGSGTSTTWSHTATGSQLLMFVQVYTDNVVTQVDAGGSAFTQVGTTITMGSGNKLSFYAGVVSAGSLTVMVTTATGASFIWGGSITFTGAQQTVSSTMDAATQSGPTTTGTFDIATGVTTVANNCWTVAGLFNNFGAASSARKDGGAGTMGNNTAGGQIVHSNGLYAAGSAGKTLGEVPATSVECAGIMCSFAPYTAPTGVGGTKLLLGVG